MVLLRGYQVKSDLCNLHFRDRFHEAFYIHTTHVSMEAKCQLSYVSSMKLVPVHISVIYFDLLVDSKG